MKIKYFCLILLLGACLLFSCIGINDEDNCSDIPIRQVTFVDKGGAVLDPISTTVIIKSDFMEYIRSQSGNIIEQWTKQIQPFEFNSVRQIIDNYNLFYRDDLTDYEQPPCEDGQNIVDPLLGISVCDPLPYCTGWRGMTITINRIDCSHTFDISGSLCVRELWPEGILALVDLKDELVAKYQ